jgi:mono/diheme cytochrome c family protein
MPVRLQEIVAMIATLAILAGVPAAIGAYQSSRNGGQGRIIELTGVMTSGAWTDEKVTAANYGLKSFRPATVTIGLGEEVTLRLSSADVTHGFYAPELGIGPLMVYPGHVVDVRLKPERAGDFMYYCNLVCGKCHHFMRGIIRVADDGGEIAEADQSPRPCPHHHQPPAADATLVQRGEHIFHSKGCIACHGEGGKGGVPNFNYIKKTVPPLAELSDKLMLFEEEDAQAVLELMNKSVDLFSKKADAPFRAYGRFLAQYKSVRDLIRNGNPAGKKDPQGPKPPLHMPSWEAELTETDIDAVFAYILTTFGYDDEDGEGE